MRSVLNSLKLAKEDVRQWILVFMIGWILGLAAGMGIGISIGNKRKLWSELSNSEKKTRIASITAGVVLLVAGVVVFLVLLLT